MTAGAITAILFSAGAAQAQSEGGLLPLLGTKSLLQAPYRMAQDTQDAGNNNNNNNNNNAGGVNNNNNNNNNGRGPNTNTNTNNNNVLGGSRDRNSGLLSVLGIGPFIQVCQPTGQAARGNNTFTGSQNINCQFS
ncbi:hypothetical protein [Streptomyces sp. NPDC018610]|uniref:hypothetical protein n=1 Tax=Streptomyces sp. NPDC018610 TaxID=3365049 RepID=UPI003793A3D7